MAPPSELPQEIADPLTPEGEFELDASAALVGASEEFLALPQWGQDIRGFFQDFDQIKRQVNAVTLLLDEQGKTFRGKLEGELIVSAGHGVKGFGVKILGFRRMKIHNLPKFTALLREIVPKLKDALAD